MARYTSTVFEILQTAAQPGEQISNLSDMTAISARSLFLNAPLNVLSENARSNFITQFTLHYMRDEIGMETLPLWRLALAEKLYNNAAYINAVYENLYRQAYTEYEQKLNQSNGTRTRVGTATDVRTDDITTENNQTNISNSSGTRNNTGTQSTDGINTNVQTNDLTDTTRQTGTDTTAKIGTETGTDTGTQQNANDLTDTQNYNSTDTQNYNSTVTQNYGAINEDLKNTKQTEKKVENYDLVSEKSFDQRKREKSFAGKQIDDGSTQTDSNAMNLNFDTPQGSLDELRDPGGVPGSGSGASAVGKGIAYATGQDYNYFSAAAEADATTWNTNHNERSYDNYKETDQDSGKEVNTEKHRIDGTTNKDEREIYTKFEPQTLEVSDGTHTRYLNGDVNVKSGSDSNVKSGSDSLAKSGADTLTRTGTTTRTDNLTHEILYDTEVTDTKNLTTTGSKTGTVSDNGMLHNTVTDNLREDTSNSAVNTGNGTVKSTGSVTNDTEHTDIDNDRKDGNEERFKVDFLAFCMKPNLMDKVWQVFDDLFMWLYN
ncbi:MAG: hypothetical protein IIY21_13060 [Clostridiales bacterium]|nr:hypothetical protein [Clostridiales bacterium]